MNQNELYAVREYNFYNPITIEIDAIIDKCFRDRHNSFFHYFIYECIYDIKLTIFTNNEMNILKTSGKSMGLFELKKKLTVARQNGFKFNQINTLKMKFF